MTRIYQQPTHVDMEARIQRLCEYCARLLPIEHIGHTTRPFHPTLAALLENPGACKICIFMRNHLDLDEESDLVSEEAYLSYDFMTLQLRLKEPHDCEEGVRWAILELSIFVPGEHSRKRFMRTFSLTTCEPS